jgi:hypothetical protein
MADYGSRFERMPTHAMRPHEWGTRACCRFSCVGHPPITRFCGFNSDVGHPIHVDLPHRTYEPFGKDKSDALGASGRPLFISGMSA